MREKVVSYRNSTSNHNSEVTINSRPVVVSYRNSTSNHNLVPYYCNIGLLYLIEILHQTTTKNRGEHSDDGCILSKFYIKPQQVHAQKFPRLGCILSKFYIKPQLPSVFYNLWIVVSYRNSTSNHNIFCVDFPKI